MAIEVICGCGQRHEAVDRSAGLHFTCYRCLVRIRIPVPGEEAPPAVPAGDVKVEARADLPGGDQRGGR